MKIYKNIFILILPLLVACQTTDVSGPLLDELQSKQEMQFTGELWSDAGNLPEGLEAAWEENDIISILSDDFPEANEKFTVRPETASRAVICGKAFPGSTYAAISPFRIGSRLSEGKILTDIPVIQHIQSGKFPKKANVAVATSRDNHLHFKSICALLSFKVPEIASLETVSIKGNSGEKIAGNIAILANGENISIETDDSSSEELLLTGEMRPGETCLVPIIPGGFDQGVSLTFKDVHDRKYILHIQTAVETAAGKITEIPASGTIPEALDIRLPGYTTENNETQIIRPGLMLSKISFRSAEGEPVQTFLYEIGLELEDLTITQTTPNGKELGNDLQQVTGQALAADSPERKILGGTNSDFFDMWNGTNLPHGVFHHRGVCYKDYFNPDIYNWKMSFFYLTADGLAGIGAEEEYPETVQRLALEEVCGGADILLRDGILLPYKEVLEPRTCLGITRDGKKVFLMVADGRKDDYSIGMTLNQLGIYMKDAGAWSAMNLDGGGSSTFYIRDPEKDGQAPDRFNILNRPSDRNGERAVANGLAIIERAATKAR